MVAKKLTSGDYVYATGVNLEPRQRADGKWIWAVVEFQDDTYLNGDICDPSRECAADTCEGLLQYDTGRYDTEEQTDGSAV